MTTMIAVNSIIIVRDKKQRMIKPGEHFDFTTEELDDIYAVDKGAVRKPINETAAAKPQSKSSSNKDDM